MWKVGRRDSDVLLYVAHPGWPAPNRTGTGSLMRCTFRGDCLSRCTFDRGRLDGVARGVACKRCT
eukprot:7380145-Prymnesium_polylepis.2